MDHCLIFTPICTALKPPYMILVYMVRTLMNKSVLHCGRRKIVWCERRVYSWMPSQAMQVSKCMRATQIEPRERDPGVLRDFCND